MKLSQWHSGKVKPVHVGVYEVQPSQEYKYYSWFDGKIWRGHWLSIDTAFENKYYEYEGSKTKNWRGIVK